jgi:hypothetical protein
MNLGAQLLRIIKEYPLAAFCVVLMLVCSVLLFIRGGTADELSAVEAELNSRIRVIDQNVKNSGNLEKDVEILDELVKQLEGKLFDRNQRAVNINFFYSMEAPTGIRITNISQSSEGGAMYVKGGIRALKLLSTISYSISLNGSFENILLFLHRLDRVDPLIRVVDFELSKGNSRGGDGQTLDARLSLIVMAQK